MKKLLTLVAIGLSLSPLAVNAALLHHYNLSDANDSVGTANGTINGAASFTTSPGMLTTSGNDNTSYLSLPASVGTGITGDFTLQIYASTTAGTNTSYATLFSFATQQSDNNFLLFNAFRPNTSGSSFNFAQGGTIGNEKDIVANSALLSDGAEHDLLLTYTTATGAVSIYNNGTLAGTGNVGAGFNFSLAANGPFNGINGHAPFTNDNTFAGSTDDFRIYNQALTAAQATALQGAGVNASNAAISAIVPEPSTWAFVLGGAGLVGLAFQRRGTRRA